MKRGLLVGFATFGLTVLACAPEETECANILCGQGGPSSSNSSTGTDSSTATGSDSSSSIEDAAASTDDSAMSSGSDAAADTGVAAKPDAGPSMSFFVTATGSGNKGGNLGGLAGADAICQAAASAVGAGARTWRAYLSTNTNDGGTLVHAKDRIGKGPWYNQKLELIANDVAALHAANIPAAKVVNENGGTTPGNRHDILTGSTTAGMATMDNCANWTSNAATNPKATLGHSDSSSGQWNNAHASQGCSDANLTGTGGDGRIYCFAE